MRESNKIDRLAPLSGELEKAKLGDKRLSKRLGNMVDLLTLKSDLSFPQAMGSDAALEGFYRFIRNKKVSKDRILEPLWQALLAITKVTATQAVKFSGAAIQNY